ncbi:hypothetical protein [Lysobacter sp. CFH 32150]|uniref:hypothetical protein n=1 Tax=Lysobacter sp. CFH 32150 TaxID=2927128 RepID=UPI001FA71185|nr:hypothetical protein [Lysobacter sp. CFH 32150]MCI4567130.1 hypothetical protein [Lysobacter sp. CFH 32150]
MNRKLHNTVAALLATTGMLVLALIAASPMPLQPAATAPAFAQASANKVDRVEATARNIEARAKLLESRLAKTTEAADAVAQVAAFAAEAATLAVLAETFDGGSAQAASVSKPAEQTPIRRSRQSVAMPYFSFAPRG